jgi:hypothetical protein
MALADHDAGLTMNTEKDNSKHDTHDGDPSWLERNVNLVIVGLIVACLGTLVAQWLYTPMFDEHHPAHFEQENIFGFEAMFGFAAFVVVVFLGRILRVFVKREEDYYDS